MVPVLELVVPFVEVNVKNYKATSCKACHQVPVKNKEKKFHWTPYEKQHKVRCKSVNCTIWLVLLSPHTEGILWASLWSQGNCADRHFRLILHPLPLVFWPRMRGQVLQTNPTCPRYTGRSVISEGVIIVIIIIITGISEWTSLPMTHKHNRGHGQGGSAHIRTGVGDWPVPVCDPEVVVGSSVKGSIFYHCTTTDCVHLRLLPLIMWQGEWAHTAITGRVCVENVQVVRAPHLHDAVIASDHQVLAVSTHYHALQDKWRD